MTDGWPEVRAMCAIGRRGELGLGGRMPWEGRREPAFIADVARFFAATRGHVLIAGPRTFASIPPAIAAGRTVVQIRSSMEPRATLARFSRRVVYVCGGPTVWAAYAPWIVHWDITRLPYEGEADRRFDPAWLVAGAPPGERPGGVDGV